MGLESRGRILVADDSPLVRKIVCGDLARAGFDSAEAADGAAALTLLEGEPFDVVVTDMRMPGLNGLELLAAIRGRSLGTEVVILTAAAAGDMANVVQALRLGAHDYLTKPPSSPEEIVLTVERAVEKKRLREANARLVRELAALSTTDPLTGLKNRRALDETLALEFERARRYGVPLSVAIVDMDHFKKVNDRHGHPAGDALLRHLAGLIGGVLRSTDSGYRYGGEEFVLVFPHTPEDGAFQALERLRLELRRAPLQFGGAEIAATCSAGLAEIDPADLAAADLIVRADAAVYSAKKAGRDRVEVAARPRRLRVAGSRRTA